MILQTLIPLFFSFQHRDVVGVSVTGLVKPLSYQVTERTSLALPSQKQTLCRQLVES